MIKKILMVLCLLFVLCDAAMANDEYFRVEYFENPDICVYSPAVIEENTLYPVLYLIHGRWQDVSIWEEIGLSEVLDSLYAAGEIIPFYIVLPHDKTYLENMYLSEFHDEFLNQVMPFVEENFPVDRSPKNVAVGGISRGAQWAQFFGFSELGRFGHLGIHSPANAFFSYPKIYGIFRDHPDAATIRVRIDIGNQDSMLNLGSEVSVQLVSLHYPHEFIVGEGGHDAEYWGKNLPDYIRWYSEGFRPVTGL